MEYSVWSLVAVDEPMCACVHAEMLQYYVQLFAILWTITHQAPLSWGFSRQEYWRGLPYPPLEDHPDPGMEPASLMSPALAGGFFTTSATWEAQMNLYCSSSPPENGNFGLLCSKLSDSWHDLPCPAQSWGRSSWSIAKNPFSPIHVTPLTMPYSGYPISPRLPPWWHPPALSFSGLDYRLHVLKSYWGHGINSHLLPSLLPHSFHSTPTKQQE